MNFQKTVVIVAVVVLLVSVIFLGVTLYKEKHSAEYPPVTSSCPDYWENNSYDSVSKCFNTKNLGNDSCAKTMDFSLSHWSGNDGLCNKSKWAKECEMTWDGITNNPKLCSDEE